MNPKIKIRSNFLYEEIVENISNQISKGILKTGDKLPTVRKLSRDLQVSMTTVLHSYAQLENLGLIESKPQSGFYIKNISNKILPEPEILTLETAIKVYNGDELISNVHELTEIQDIVSLGGGIPTADMLSAKKLSRIAGAIIRNSEAAGILYEFPPGYYKLRCEIAKRSIGWGGNISPDDVIITTGAIEAIILSLKAVAKPGDIIITESPTFYLLLQVIKDLGMKILEVPTHPKDGIEIDTLKMVLNKHKVAACVIYPTINNPLGSIMPKDNRKKLYNILASYDIPLIEGDVWGELHFEDHSPKPIKSLDDKGIVLYFSSFTKTGAPGHRVGWVCPGKYYKKVKDLKYRHTIASATLPQMIIAEFMRTRGYERNIRNLCKLYESRLSLLSKCVSEYFPDGTKISKPRGGAFIWVELPKSVNSIELQKQAFRQNISINPGPLFSTTDNFSNYIRLSCACKWESRTIENAVKSLGELCRGFT